MAKQRATRPHELRSILGLDILPANRIELLSRNINSFEVKKGGVIYRTGERAKNLYVVLDGEIGLSLFGSNGRFVRLSVLSEGEFFGICALIPSWQRVSFAIALRDSRIGEIPPRRFVRDVCGVSLEGFCALSELTLKPILLVSLRRSLFLVEPLTNRLALALWEYSEHPKAKKNSGYLPSSLTHEELSAIVGASRSRVSRALKQLEKKGLFHRKGRSIQVLSDKLRAYLANELEHLL